MLNLEEINNTIEQLENGDTTFDACIKLASLYTVKEHISNNTIKSVDNVIDELNDILPAYTYYKEVKREYQLGNASETAIIKQINSVCKEISEFISTLYSGTDMLEERNIIIFMLSELAKRYQYSNTSSISETETR